MQSYRESKEAKRTSSKECRIHMTASRSSIQTTPSNIRSKLSALMYTICRVTTSLTRPIYFSFTTQGDRERLPYK